MLILIMIIFNLKNAEISTIQTLTHHTHLSSKVCVGGVIQFPVLQKAHYLVNTTFI